MNGTLAQATSTAGRKQSQILQDFAAAPTASNLPSSSARHSRKCFIMKYSIELRQWYTYSATSGACLAGRTAARSEFATPGGGH